MALQGVSSKGCTLSKLVELALKHKHVLPCTYSRRCYSYVCTCAPMHYRWMGLFGHRSLKRTLLWGNAYLCCNKLQITCTSKILYASTISEVSNQQNKAHSVDNPRPWTNLFSLQSHIRRADRERFNWTSEGNTKITRTNSGRIKNVSHGCCVV